MTDLMRTWVAGVKFKPLEMIIFGLSAYINNTDKELINDVPGIYYTTSNDYPISWQQIRGLHPDPTREFITHMDEYMTYNDGNPIPTIPGDGSIDGEVIKQIRKYFNDTEYQLVFNTGNWTRL